MSIKIDMNLCRVCRKPGPGTSIHTGDILDKFLYTTLVQAEKNDGLPEIICRKCLARLHIAYDFKKDAVKTNKELRSFLSKINKDYQQLTAGGGSVSGSGGVKSKNKPQNESIHMDGTESYDELDEDMQELLNEHQVKDDPDDGSTDGACDDNNQELVELLGANNDVIEIQEPRLSRNQLITIHDSTENDGPPANIMYIIDGNSEMDSNDSDYVPDYSDENTADDPIDTQLEYLEYDENVDQLCDATTAKKQSSPQKQTKNASSYNPDNRCDVCDKSFSTRTNLTRHKITHEGRKPYVCQICNNSFTQKGSLNSHMYIHTGERPFQCKECGKAFTQSKSLVFHMRRHTGEKPFPCDVCGVQFRQKDGLKRHIAAKHMPSNTKHFICDVCGKALLSKYSLNMHASKHSAKEVAVARKNHLKSERAAAKRAARGVVTKTEDILPAEEAYELYVCEYCDQEFTSLADQLEHRETHTELQDTKYIDDSS